MPCVSRISFSRPTPAHFMASGHSEGSGSASCQSTFEHGIRECRNVEASERGGGDTSDMRWRVHGSFSPIVLHSTSQVYWHFITRYCTILHARFCSRNSCCFFFFFLALKLTASLEKAVAWLLTSPRLRQDSNMGQKTDVHGWRCDAAAPASQIGYKILTA